MKKGNLLCYKRETDLKHSTYYRIVKGCFIEKTGTDVENEQILLIKNRKGKYFRLELF